MAIFGISILENTGRISMGKKLSIKPKASGNYISGAFFI
jgi:hypothetical protein